MKNRLLLIMTLFISMLVMCISTITAGEENTQSPPTSLTTNQTETQAVEPEPENSYYPSGVRTGSVRIEKGRTAGDTVVMFGNLTVAGHVTGDAVAIIGKVTVLPGGRIDGDAVAPFGSVRVMPGGSVGGDVVGIGGGVYLPEGAAVGGEVVDIGLSGLKLLKPLNWLKPKYIPGLSWQFDIVNNILDGIVFAILAMILFALFPRRMENIAEVAIAKAGGSALYGIVGIFIIVFGFLALIGSCVGIPIAIAAVVLTIAAWIFGKMAIGLALGRRLGDAFNRPLLPGMLAIFIGIMVLSLIGLIPFVGWLFVWILALIGFGAVIITGFGASPTWWQDRKNQRGRSVKDNTSSSES